MLSKISILSGGYSSEVERLTVAEKVEGSIPSIRPISPASDDADFQGAESLRQALLERVPKRIIVLLRDHVGDVVNSTGALRHLVFKYPRASFTVEVGMAGAAIIRSLPRVHVWERRHHMGLLGKVWFVLRLRLGRFDLGVIFDDSNEKIQHLWLGGVRTRVGIRKTKYFDLFTASAAFQPDKHDLFESLKAILTLLRCKVDVAPVLELPKEARSHAEQVLKKLNTRRPLIGFHIGASEFSKRWPEHHFARVADSLSDEGYSPVLLYGPGEADIADRVIQSAHRPLQRLEPLPILSYCALLQKLPLLITNDSGPAHLAAALHIPAVVIYGATDPKRFHPYGDTSALLNADVGCDLYANQCMAACDEGVICDRRCMEAVSVEQVLNEAMRMLSATTGKK
jgi:heptosyltransferase-2